MPLTECCWLCLEWALLQVNSAGWGGSALGWWDGNSRDLPASSCKQELSAMLVRLAGALLLREGELLSLSWHSFAQFHVFVWGARGVWSHTVPSLKRQCSGD